MRCPSALIPQIILIGLALLAATTGCGSTAVSVDAPDLDDADATPCARLLAALPPSLADQPRRDIEPAGAPAAAWGEREIVVTCGVDEPAAYDEYAACIDVDGTGWFAPEDAYADPTADLVLTELTYRPRVSVSVPSAYRGDDRILTSLAEPIRTTLERASRCR